MKPPRSDKSFIDKLEVHINTIVKKEAYITLAHTHTTIIKYVTQLHPLK